VRGRSDSDAETTHANRSGAIHEDLLKTWLAEHDVDRERGRSVHERDDLCSSDEVLVAELQIEASC